jgi:hypothetical protein
MKLLDAAGPIWVQKKCGGKMNERGRRGIGTYGVISDPPSGLSSRRNEMKCRSILNVSRDGEEWKKYIRLVNRKKSQSG